MRERLARISAGASTALLAFAVNAITQTAAPVAHASGGVGFAPTQYLSTQLAGGEPFVAWDPKYGTLVYSSHEGTTHLDRSALGLGAQQFVCSSQDLTCYSNHVNTWYSTDEGGSWTVVPPQSEFVQGTGFSDPDLTIDEAGNIYNTGIDLANDALFSSADGGKTWPTGTPQCHEGDRPWLAAGKPGHVFLATNSSQSGHIIVRSTDAGATCGSTAVPDAGNYLNGSYSGVGKLYYDHHDSSLIEPATFSLGAYRIGISYLGDADRAFDTGIGAFTPIPATPPTSKLSHWPAIALDDSQNVYIAWDTNPHAPSSSGGCNGGPTPVANQVMLVVGTRKAPGRYTWSAPITIASPPSSTVYWPWVAAGAAGNASVVWYQTDKVDDLDCDQMNGQTVNEKTTIYEAQVLGALSGTPSVSVVNASGRVIHTGGVCQGGTTCVATGQDRRLGDFFTNSIDKNGCVMIASGDTMQKDALGQELITSRPIFIKQNSGPSLTGIDCATGQALAASTAAAAPAPSPAAGLLPLTSPAPGAPASPAALAGGSLLAGAATIVLRRRRRPR